MTNYELTRRRFLRTSLAAGTAALPLAGLASQAHAQDYPSRKLTAYIPFAPGGGTDRSVRLVTPVWGQLLGGDFVLDHKPGAGSLIAQDLMANAPHDAHAVVFTPAPHTAWLAQLEAERFSTDQVAWVGSYFQDPNVLLVSKDSPYNTLEEFLDAAASADKPFTASVSSALSAAHAATVVLREKAGIPLQVVPFGGGGPARNAVAGGHVDCCMAPYWSATNVLELTKALAIFWPEDPTEGLWNAPPANEILPFEMPYLSEPYGAQISRKSAENHPDRYQRLTETFEQTLQHPEFLKGADAQSLTPFIRHMDAAECEAWSTDYLGLLAEYRSSMERDLEDM
ncbi:tripartite tricarboxylate transporter substrate-binding protein [Hoeflea sp. YIM 152468]|uniref:Bug family tripartite tricarboxylate transporter substrate binding protein n=1 Tax=Hoeflea sp. YIM 152468 TaxID=3031759 RepID=UPI0023D9B878|nr:tripartite tricarboxylate transporter substrate-binding protein [Hoeflea sp. YIM 152468]MDF1608685.1 tripartite tricarboxylate transporter substrate-binding protein [Hoeflea sp. YIM 152468]